MFPAEHPVQVSKLLAHRLQPTTEQGLMRTKALTMVSLPWPVAYVPVLVLTQVGVPLLTKMAAGAVVPQVVHLLRWRTWPVVHWVQVLKSAEHKLQPDTAQGLMRTKAVTVGSLPWP